MRKTADKERQHPLECLQGCHPLQASIITRESTKMEGFESSTVMANFRPEYAQCPRHGRWQSNRLDEAGVIRFLAHCPLCDREKIIARAAIPSRFEGREFGNYIVELPRTAPCAGSGARLRGTFRRKASRRYLLGVHGPPGYGEEPSRHSYRRSRNETRLQRIVSQRLRCDSRRTRYMASRCL